VAKGEKVSRHKIAVPGDLLLAIPALAIVGGIDPWKATVDEMEKVMSNLKVKVIEGTYHATCLSSATFANEIKAFLDAHSASPAGKKESYVDVLLYCPHSRPDDVTG
jgi:hypothetical protein